MSGSINLVVQSFGREQEYRRAILTIISFFAHANNKRSLRVLFFTDKPSYFSEYLKELPVTYILLTPEKISEMRGKINFLHRMKIAMIEESFNITKGDLLYADSDTFFISDPAPLTDKLSDGISFMHLAEYPFHSLSTTAFQSAAAFYRSISSNTFSLSSQAKLKIDLSLYSWNAGVMMLHSSHARLLPDVYLLTDQFFIQSASHASEQFAFSVILQLNTKVSACNEIICHYWYRVEKEIMDDFLFQHITAEWASHSPSKKLQDVKKWAMELPEHIETHWRLLRDNAIKAFFQNDYKKGYALALKGLLHGPKKASFLRDIAYHTKRRLTGAK